MRSNHPESGRSQHFSARRCAGGVPCRSPRAQAAIDGRRVVASSSRKRRRLAGITTDQGQVLWREQHRAERAEDFARAAHRRPIQPGLVGPARRDLQIDGQLPALVHDDRRHDRPVGARPYQGARPTPPDVMPMSTNTTVLQRCSSCRSRSVRRTPCGQASVPTRRPTRNGSPSASVDVRTPLSPASLHRRALGQPDSLILCTACPPNWLRNAATAFMVGESSWRERNLANNAAAMAGTGTLRRIASSTVQRPSPESSV